MYRVQLWTVLDLTAARLFTDVQSHPLIDATVLFPLALQPPIWALVYLHETLHFTSVYWVLDIR
jgi:hypothetical protein